jgi:two-component system chemotaxis response regulator CheB
MRTVMSNTRRDVVAIGISTGGPNALAQMVPSLPGDLRTPVLIVQHMPPVFTAALAESLSKKSRLSVVEGAEGMTVSPKTVYIAPGGKQMMIEKSGFEVVIRITDAPPENNCKPSADYLFRSVADVYGSAALGVIMTGMGSDGVKGLLVMKEKGARVIAQDEATCTVYGMPMEAAKAGVPDIVVPLEKIADEIVSSVV